MKSLILMAFILQLFLRLGKTEVVLGLEVSESAPDEPSTLDHLQRRAVKKVTKPHTNTGTTPRSGQNAITCKGESGILQDCFACAEKLAKSHRSCTMFKTCAIVILEPGKNRQSRIEKMSAEELKYRVPQSLDNSCTANPKLKFEEKTFSKTPDSPKRIGVRFFKTPLKSKGVEDCNAAALKMLGL
ncbi:uncharacterized protein MELLADRAFT_69963 [Melampsora larici-populina 98AG31]|uniref:Secreted protein n=1 Tax=Melampsora larici-populina (strain 98AG31 / pathotype 3-4-7) TaxID=747676 RepID=F4SCZ0_MELLP|nr:uncharacterized protein MELLADRAFT_69963 [Melampsora larici-populina 98AG31]EGF97488.1 secreted protein [Melampsora larici-populina 98AG31]